MVHGVRHELLPRLVRVDALVSVQPADEHGTTPHVVRRGGTVAGKRAHSGVPTTTTTPPPLQPPAPPAPLWTPPHVGWRVVRVQGRTCSTCLQREGPHVHCTRRRRRRAQNTHIEEKEGQGEGGTSASCWRVACAIATSSFRRRLSRSVWQARKTHFSERRPKKRKGGLGGTKMAAYQHPAEHAPPPAAVPAARYP